MTPYLFTEAISQGREITLFDEGRPQRDFTYIEDIITGVLAAVDADLEYQIINLGNSRPGDYQVVLCTIHRSEAAQVLALQSGAVDYLVKPLHIPILIAKLERLLGTPDG